MNALRGRRLNLIVTGSIAAYKACELAREFVKLNVTVQVIMTDSAMQFVTPLTFEALTGRAVRSSLLDPAEEQSIGHIELADQCDATVVAPATADFIAKAAGGHADSLALAVLLATKRPVIIAPAMNVNMWFHPLTQSNVNRLREIGYLVVDPDEGDLACGWTGSGRLAETKKIADAVAAAFTPQDLKGREVIVTGGTTREALDPVRFVANRSSGRMGVALAEAAARRGAQVTLITGPLSCSAQLFGRTNLRVIPIETAQEMQQAVNEALEGAAAPQVAARYVIMAAAVADHRPSVVSEQKIKPSKTGGYTLEMSPNPDILSSIGERREALAKTTGVPLYVVGFAAETGTVPELLQSAREKLLRKNADLIAGNLAQEAFEQENNRVWLIRREGAEEEIPLAEKSVVGDRILSAVRALERQTAKG